MDRPLALLLCGLFVFFLLRIERRAEVNKVSFACWIPTIWMLYYASKPVSNWLAPYGLVTVTGHEIETGSPLDGNFLLILIGLGFIIIAKRKLDWKSAVQNNRLLFVLLAYMLLSCLWSEVPDRSFKQWVRVFGSVIMAFAVLTEPDPRRALQSILVRQVYVLIPLSVVLVKYVPELGVVFGKWSGERMWEGACLQKNGLGRLCLISAVFLSWRLIRRWKGKANPVSPYQTPLEIAVLLMTCFLLAGPGGRAFSATAVGTLAICLAASLGLLLPKRRFAGKLFGIIAALTMGVAVLLAVTSTTGTTTSSIWEEVRSVAWQQPILGTGYSSFWSQAHADSPNLFNLNEGHNGYLDVFLETGAIGLGLVLLLLASFIKRVKWAKRYDFDWATLGIVFLLMLVLHNFTESSLLRSSAHLWALFIFIYVMLQAGRARTSGEEPAAAAVGQSRVPAWR
jgi:exopolysaccharide production protein ExoQ